MGYTLPRQWTRKALIESLRIYFTGENLFTWSGIRSDYIDPEMAATNGNLRSYPGSGPTCSAWTSPSNRLNEKSYEKDSIDTDRRLRPDAFVVRGLARQISAGADVARRPSSRTKRASCAFSNTFYTIFPGDGLYNEGYDNIVKNEIAAEMRDGRTIPASGGGWTWTDLRKFNTLLEYSGNCRTPTSATATTPWPVSSAPTYFLRR